MAGTEAKGLGESVCFGGGERIRHVPNVLTVFRILCAAALPLTRTFSAPFFVLYGFCGLSDMLDGFIARRFRCASARGAALDSAADFVFVAVAMLTLIPVLPWRRWMLFWVLGIALLRFISLGVGWVRFRQLAFLHTVCNKATGFVLYLMPVLIPFLGFNAPAAFTCAVASLSAVEEFLLMVRCERLDRDVKGLFWKQKEKTDAIR